MTLTSDYGAQKACPKRPTCIETERTQTHFLFVFYSIEDVSLCHSPDG